MHINDDITINAVLGIQSTLIVVKNLERGYKGFCNNYKHTHTHNTYIIMTFFELLVF